MQVGSVRTAQDEAWWSRLRRLAEPRLARFRAFSDRFRPAPVEPEPYVEGETQLFPLLWRPALLGFIGGLAILYGAAQQSSPFALNSVPGSWFFGLQPAPAVGGQTVPPGSSLFISLVLVYAGIVLMLRAWLGIARVTSGHPGIPVRKLVPIFVLWMLPFLVIAPLFSRDVYSYAAQGEMMSHGINPYVYPPSTIGIGDINKWITPVDSLWRDVTSPYGPVFLGIDGFIVTLSGHNELLTIVGLRLLSVFGTGLIAVYLPRLARSYGYDGSSAFALAVLNPLILLHLIAGAHNDALMLGLLVAGLVFARSGHPIVGIVLCTLGAGVKVPALVGVIYIGWEWLGDGVPWRQRIRPLLLASLIAAAVMQVASEVVGLGWGWIGGLTNPASVLSWMDPATAVGRLGATLAGGLGFGDHLLGLLNVARAVGLLVAAGISCRLLVRSRLATSGRAIGLTMLAIVLLGPEIQPWYLAWSVVILAAVATGRIRTLVVALSCCACFLGLPGAAPLVVSLRAANPLLIAVAALSLAAVLLALLAPRIRLGITATAAQRAAVRALADDLPPREPAVREGVA
jgi:alpha-1,6-mannosyltransferase